MTSDDSTDPKGTEGDRYRLVTLALTAAALGLAIAALVLGILDDETEGTSPLLTIAVVALALNALRGVERGDG